jgi:prepilin-type N-terminal cleavage/methylation domain-containing protein
MAYEAERPSEGQQGPGQTVSPAERSQQMLAKLNRRMKSDEGFTLIELLIVLIIIAILVAIAIPSYLGFRDRANERAAQANVRAAVPSAEAFFSDHGHYNTSGTPAFTFANLQAIDTGLAPGLAAAGGVLGDANRYCLRTVVGDRAAKIRGPGGFSTSGAAATVGVCAAADLVAP